MTLTVSVITPERSLPPYAADHVTLPAFDGEVGIRTGHAPFVSLLGTGLLLLKNQTQADQVLALKGGVAQVFNNEVKILAESVAEAGRVSESDLVARLQALNAKTYDNPDELTQARAEANWYITQLKSSGKAVPDMSKLGL